LKSLLLELDPSGEVEVPKEFPLWWQRPIDYADFRIKTIWGNWNKRDNSSK